MIQAKHSQSRKLLTGKLFIGKIRCPGSRWSCSEAHLLAWLTCSAHEEAQRCLCMHVMLTSFHRGARHATACRKPYVQAQALVCMNSADGSNHERGKNVTKAVHKAATRSLHPATG
eukprot:scaffold287586_cov19-Tisochrysis_lutea.AAC.1